MKSFYKAFFVILLVIVLIFIGANLFLLRPSEDAGGRPYRVEISRLVKEIERSGMAAVDLSDYAYITNVELYDGGSEAFFKGLGSDYIIQEINGGLYRFDYSYSPSTENNNIVTMVNVILTAMSLMMIGVLIFVYQKILKPFQTLREIPYELSKGNLTAPIKENKNRYFGRFVWGMDMLRENMEQQKKRELALSRDKKTLVLSISHDIKTPLSAIKLYAKALSKGLYKDENKQREIAENINAKADEIEQFISEIIKTQNEDFLALEVIQGEFYLSEAITKLADFYREKLHLIKTDFSVGQYANCILKGDVDRSIEVLQNIIENAVKYGDGRKIEIIFSEEEDCQLITVKNSGCALPENELAHIFDSFWRGSNTGSNSGNGLGLYICRNLMHNMDGEIFAGIQNGFMCVTTVFRKAG